MASEESSLAFETIFEDTEHVVVDVASETESLTRLNIIHFNDVYNIESRETDPVGGAPRFITAIESVIKKSVDPTIVLFSGDAISPSSISMLVKGKQMIEIMNESHLAAASHGNHDFGNYLCLSTLILLGQF
jgi:2',3'-cyclic-nucleotide 2'-phosphodiesterase (5'-nucleotidase family)